MWLAMMAERIVRAHRSTPMGHAARLNGLASEEARELCRLLRGSMSSDWDVVVVSSEPNDATEIPLDQAIERRNDKSRSRFFIVPRQLVSEAAASLRDTEDTE